MSTETNICELIDYITAIMEVISHQVAIVYTDNTKAFDKIHFDI